jgi:hypothetical protein
MTEVTQERIIIAATESKGEKLQRILKEIREAKKKIEGLLEAAE